MGRLRGWWVPMVLGGSLLGAAAAPAATLNYTADSFSDGVTGGIIGGAPIPGFELYGVGYGQRGDRLYVGLSTNLPRGGYLNPLVQGGSIAWGDMFFNFSDLAFEAAIAAGAVYGVRFEAANDSGVDLGLYQVQQTASVTPTNQGFASLNQYAQRVITGGGTPSLGDIPLDGSYLSNTALPQNVIDQGRLLSTDVDFITDFSTVGFDADFGFGTALAQTGRYTYGFSVDTALLPSGDFIAHVFAECINDGIGFRGSLQAPTVAVPESVPEPTISWAGLILAIAAGGYRRLGSRSAMADPSDAFKAG